jgi:hypothetical protein
MVVMRHEGRDLTFEIAGEVVVLEQDAVLERLMPALDLALGLRVLRGAADMLHLLAIEPLREIRVDAKFDHGDDGPLVVLDPPGDNGRAPLHSRGEIDPDLSEASSARSSEWREPLPPRPRKRARSQTRIVKLHLLELSRPVCTSEG